jgi:hypothetical protein
LSDSLSSGNFQRLCPGSGMPRAFSLAGQGRAGSSVELVDDSGKQVRLFFRETQHVVQDAEIVFLIINPVSSVLLAQAVPAFFQ